MAVLAGVELDEVGAGLVLLADEDGDAEDGVRCVEELVGAARALPRKDEADEVCARLDGGVDVLLAGQATDLDEGPRDQPRERGARIGGAHQRRADEDRVGARELGRGALGACRDGGLGDDDPVARRAREQGELCSSVDREGREVARVDADHGSPERDRAVELGRVVRLDERVEPEGLRVLQQPRTRLVVEIAKDEERRVGAGLARRPQMVGRREEALGEQRQRRFRPGRAQVVPRAGEPLVHEHRHRARPGALVAGGRRRPRRRPAGGRPPTASAA